MRRVLIEYIIKNKKNFIVISIFFCIGCILGIIFVNNSNDIQKAEISNYVSSLIKNIKNSENVDRINLLITSLKQNILVIIIIWFLGCTIIGGIFIYIAIIYKGFAIGYTISSLIAVLGIKTGTLVTVCSLLLQNIIFLPVFFIISENRDKII